MFGLILSVLSKTGNISRVESLKMAGYYEESIFILAAAIDSVENGLELPRSLSQATSRLARFPYRDISG